MCWPPPSSARASRRTKWKTCWSAAPFPKAPRAAISRARWPCAQAAGHHGRHDRHRFCSSGLQAIALAAQRIMAGEGDIDAAGGVESISCVQNEMNTHMYREVWLQQHKPEVYWPCCRRPKPWPSATGFRASARTRDGAQSQQRAASAQAAGLFAAEIVPMSTIMGENMY